MIQKIYQHQIAELGRHDFQGENELQRMIAESWVRVDYGGSNDKSDSDESSDMRDIDGAFDEIAIENTFPVSVQPYASG